MALAYECISNATLAGLETALNTVTIKEGTLTIAHDGTNYIACYVKLT